MPDRKLDIIVLTGGDSSEREVSLESSAAIVGALLERGHGVRAVDPCDGEYLALKDDRLVNDKNGSGSKGKKPIDFAAFTRTIDDARSTLDVVLLGLHGGSGENGRLQAVLELMDIPYTGSPAAASAIAMNKDISKRIMQSLGIPTAPWLIYDMFQGLTAEGILGKLRREKLKFPLIVKPADSGSTVGLTLVENPDRLPEAIKASAEESPLIMVENYIEGREITIAVMNGRALPPVEIKPSHKLYDYTCKYTKGKSQYFCPADIDRELSEKISRDAVLFHNTIGCRGYSRVDFIISPNGTYACLELNTLPGMTGLSLFPMAARETGLEFGELLENLCLLALEGR